MDTHSPVALSSSSHALRLSASLPSFSLNVALASDISGRTHRPSMNPGTSPSTVDLQHHIYNSLLESRTADVALHVRGTWQAVYKLHRVVLIQSGFFNSLFTAGFLESSPGLSGSLSGQQDVNIVFDDCNITRAGTVCISRLYGGGPPLHFSHPSSSSPELPKGHHPATPRFLLSLLATAVYLSIPSIASQALSYILSTVGPYTVLPYLRFATGIPIGASDDNEPDAAVGLEKIAILTNHDSIRTEPRDFLADKLHELAVQKEDPRESDAQSEGEAEDRPHYTPCFDYGALSNKIGEAAKAPSGRDFLLPPPVAVPSTRKRAETLPSRPSEEAVVHVPPRPPTIWARGGLTSKWIRELISSDTLFVKGERERYDLARAVVELRRKQGIDEDEEKDWEIMFSEGIYYANMLVEDIIAISQDISPSTKRSFVPIPVLQAAHWNQSLLRCHITSSSINPSMPSPNPPMRDKELGVCLTTAQILSRLSPSEQHTAPDDEKERVYHPVPYDSSMRLGDSSGLEGASMDQLFEHTASSSDSNSAPTSEANFFGLKAERKTALECITSDATGKTRWSPYPPCRFAVEFWDINALKEKSRLHSHTIWYAGSLFNVYVQVVRKKGTQLGIYLHRQSSVDPIPGASSPVQFVRERNHNRVPSLPHHIPTPAFSPTIHYSPSIHPPSRSVTPSSAPSTSHGSDKAHQSFGNAIPATAPPVAPVQPYRDPRPSVAAYFAVSCMSSTGSSVTRFTSVPDVFSVSQSWGWKSSSLRSDDIGGRGDDEQPKPPGTAPKEVSLRATVLLGVV
ncbi:hypothetical protein EDC04DRAFT_2770258 [Pisolithus marmoratus]|nr:hypothetical protein EDC04DRAFT_2770258 [Pisolithus marmoratus]